MDLEFDWEIGFCACVEAAGTPYTCSCALWTWLLDFLRVSEFLAHIPGSILRLVSEDHGRG
jgi:hypothetical protein